jgi:hypothetical protein
MIRLYPVSEVRDEVALEEMLATQEHVDVWGCPPAYGTGGNPPAYGWALRERPWSSWTQREQPWGICTAEGRGDGCQTFTRQIRYGLPDQDDSGRRRFWREGKGGGCGSGSYADRHTRSWGQGGRLVGTEVLE